MALDRTVDVEIAAIGSRGDGVATTEKGMIYVPYSGPGDLVRVRLPAKKTGHTHAEIVEILRPGPDSQAPVCPHFTECGGCSVQHLAYPAYETWKRQLVCSALQQPERPRVVCFLDTAHHVVISSSRGSIVRFSRRQSWNPSMTFGIYCSVS
jgi:23S rRNA (uracil1939-C5)-methyltransferase